MYNVMYKEHHMTRMVRKQIYIRPEQEDMLKRKAKELGVTEAALLRLGIDEVLSTERSSSAREVWQEELEFIRKRAWEHTKALVKKRMCMDVPQTGRDWTRDELYEERFERFSR